MPRKYKLGKRAQHQEETRQRIVEATVALHEALGVSNTSISAIAERAGVERATVYRHFPDDSTLLQACTSHYFAQNQPPEPDGWVEIDDPEKRLRMGLVQVYAYHRRTEQMFTRVVSDLPHMPVLREALTPMFEYWNRVRTVLVERWEAGDEERPLLVAAVGHAISFQTWQSLVREHDLDDVESVELMVGMVKCAASGSWEESGVDPATLDATNSAI